MRNSLNFSQLGKTVRIYFLIVCCFQSSNLYSEDTLAVKSLLTESKRLRKAKPDSSIIFAKQALYLSDSLDYLKGISQSKTILGLIYKGRYEYDLASKYLDFCENANVAKLSRCNCFMLRGNMTRDTANYEEAVLLYEKGIALANELKNTNRLSSFYNSLAITYDYKQDFESAIKYHLLSGDMSLSLNDSIGYATSLQNIGILYRQLREPIRALENYDTALKYGKGSLGKQMIIEHLKGVAYYELEDFDKAISSYEKVIESGYDKYELQAITYLDLAAAQLELQELEEALQNCKEGLKVAISDRRKFRLYITISDILLHQDKCAKAQSNISVAENYIKNEKEYETLASFYETKLRISLCNKRDNKLSNVDSFLYNMDKYYFEKKEYEAKHLAVKFETEKKELQNQILQSDNEKKEALIYNLWLCGALLLSIAIGLLGLFWFRNQALKKDQQLSQLSMQHLEQSNQKLAHQLQELKEKQKPSVPTSEEVTQSTNTISDDLKLTIPNKPENITIQLNKVVYVKSAKNLLGHFCRRERSTYYIPSNAKRFHRRMVTRKSLYSYSQRTYSEQKLYNRF